MMCINCDKEIKADKRFCSNCGTPAPKKEHICHSCEAKLEENDIFCPDCGTRYSERHMPQSQTIEKPQVLTPNLDVHVNTAKGDMAFMGDTIFFKYNNVIYNVPIDGSRKAEVLLSEQDFVQSEYISEENSFGYISNLNAWNGKLYFYTSIDIKSDRDKVLFGEDENRHRIRGIFAYLPQTKKLELVLDWFSMEGLEDRYIYLKENMVFYFRKANGEEKATWRTSMAEKYGKFTSEYSEVTEVEPNIFGSINLETKEKTEKIMPVMKYGAWPIYGRDSDDNDRFIGESWYIPFYIKGYIYTSTCGSLGPIRFPVNDPEKYEVLPSGIGLVDMQDIDKFTVNGDSILAYNFDNNQLTSLSSKTLQIKETFKHDCQTSTIFDDNYFVCHGSYNGEYKTMLYKVDEAKGLGSVDVAYAYMNDTIYLNNKTYALKEVCLEDNNGKIIYDGLALYIIPWDKMFKKDTCLDDFVKPLF